MISDVLRDALSGRGRLLVIEGAAGIGKTSLAARLAKIGEGEGVEVVWGRCWEGKGSLAYWPWIQVIRSLSFRRTADQLQQVLARQASDIVHLVPDIRELVPEVVLLPLPKGPDEERFRLFDSVASFLRRCVVDRPLIVTIDDVHWLDPMSFDLLRFIVNSIEDVRVLIVVTCRNDDLDDRADILAGIESLMKVGPTACRLKLEGLGEPEVLALLRFEYPQIPDVIKAQVANRLVEETGGNPFFVTELIRALGDRSVVPDQLSGMSRLAVPDGLRQVLLRRVRALSAEAIRFVEASAIVGREVNLAVVQRATHTGTEAFDEVCRSGLIEPITDDIGAFRFQHSLVREAIRTGLGEQRRRVLHGELACAIEGIGGGALPGRIAALSFHYVNSLPEGDVERAIHYSVKSAEDAADRLAYAEAAEHCRNALAAERLRPDRPRRRAEMFLMLGEALTRVGDLPGARESFLSAAEVSRQTGEHDTLARAALGICELFPPMQGLDRKLQEFLEEVLGLLADSVNALHSKVLAGAATALQFSKSVSERTEMCERALAIARESKDSIAEMHALEASHYAWLTPIGLPKRLSIADDLVRLADKLGDREMSLRGRYHLLMNHLEQNNILAAEVQLEIVDTLASELRQPRYQWQMGVVRAMIALLRGQFEIARELSRSAYERGERFSHSRAQLAFVAHSFWLRRDLGELDELAAIRTQPVGSDAPPQVWEAVIALILAETGHHVEVKNILCLWRIESLSDSPFATTVAALLAAAAGIAKVPERAHELYNYLLPFRGRGVVPGLGAPVALGSVDLYLGILAALMLDWEAANGHLTTALNAHVRIGARPLVVRTRLEFASVLNELGHQLDARAQLQDAISEGESLGMRTCVMRAREKLEQLPVVDSPGMARAPAPRLPAAVFRSEGDFWTISFAGRTVRIKGVRGFRYIAYLLARAHEPVHVLDLAVLGVGPESRGIAQVLADQEGLTLVRAGAPGMVSDERARAQYRGRLRELSAEREEAEKLNDYGRLEKLDREIEALRRHLTAGSAAGGRSRGWASPPERARVSVRNAIAKAYRLIGQYHEPLHRHLRNALKTGVVCMYTPEQTVTWDISTE